MLRSTPNRNQRPCRTYLEMLSLKSTRNSWRRTKSCLWSIDIQIFFRLNWLRPNIDSHDGIHFRSNCWVLSSDSSMRTKFSLARFWESWYLIYFGFSCSRFVHKNVQILNVIKDSTNLKVFRSRFYRPQDGEKYSHDQGKSGRAIEQRLRDVCISDIYIIFFDIMNYVVFDSAYLIWWI